MSHIDKQYRYNLGMNIPKYLGFFETLTHLDHIDRYLTPIDTATHFLNFWRQKHQKMQNNILHKKMAFAFDEQAQLAENRFYKVQRGFTLRLSDFQGKILTFFEKSYPQFSKAIFLMETFYEDPSMFFEENLESDQEIDYPDFSDDESELWDLEVLSVKEGYSEYIAVESLYEKVSMNMSFHEETIIFKDKIEKYNQIFKKSDESDFVDLNIFSKYGEKFDIVESEFFKNDFDPRSEISDLDETLRYNDVKPLYPGLHNSESFTFKNSADKSDFCLKWNFADFHSKNGNFYLKNFDKGFCFKQPSIFFKFARSEHLMSRVDNSKSQIFGGRGHRLIMTLESKISKFKFFHIF